MKGFPFPCAFIGAGVALLFAGGYVLFGPMDFLGAPEPKWAQIALFPGILVGTQVYTSVTHSLAASYVAGVATMTVLGGLLGGALDVFAGNRDD